MRRLAIIAILLLGGCNESTGPRLQSTGEQLSQMGKVQKPVICNTRKVGAFLQTTCN